MLVPIQKLSCVVYYRAVYYGVASKYSICLTAFCITAVSLNLPSMGGTKDEETVLYFISLHHTVLYFTATHCLPLQCTALISVQY